MVHVMSVILYLPFLFLGISLKPLSILHTKGFLTRETISAITGILETGILGVKLKIFFGWGNPQMPLKDCSFAVQNPP